MSLESFHVEVLQAQGVPPTLAQHIVATVEGLERRIAHFEHDAYFCELEQQRAENAKLRAELAKEDAAHEVTIRQRDAAEAAADRLTSAILSEPIDWPDHAAKWAEAIEEADSYNPQG